MASGEIRYKVENYQFEASEEIEEVMIFGIPEVFKRGQRHSLLIEILIEPNSITSTGQLDKKTKDGIIFISDLTKEQKEYLGL
jgi:hypothetical protein